MSAPVIPARPGWRYLAQRITGDGQPGEWLDTDVPLTGAKVTSVLSGPGRLTGTLDPVYRRLKAGDGRPLLDEWGTILYAEADGSIQGAGIYLTGDFDGPRWNLMGAGFPAYPSGMGYTGPPYSETAVDPLDVVRHLYDTLQAGQDSNLGLNIDRATTTPVRLGTELDDKGQPKPYELNEWSTDDMSRVIDDLAKATPFDYMERHYWNQRRDQVIHELVFGYPRLGQRRRGLRFVLGENIHTVPSASRDGSGYANHVRFLGAGEGRDMVRAETMLSTGRLRRMVTVDDKSVQATEHAHRRAAEELNRRLPLLNIANVVIRDTPNTPLGSFGPGDEVQLQGELDWLGEIDLWMRVVSVTVSPDTPEVIEATLVRSGL